ncbi:TRASH domain-containing protein [Sphingobacterium yanglingense]|uniref:TRASH domain-containing protein n=1 Tax=Sphingobacterium yanglingense TaxID=1437280 RepID=A0A4R6WFP0_9SPHI|nr:TRASH domain-containing protein [Sphingobacterium yanglingense]TDQ76983.1 TRASH domain-containing protein [Sphingobacterium yanglingense]
MKSITKILGIATMVAISFTACNSGDKKIDDTAALSLDRQAINTSKNPLKGKQVPQNLVCMVNDAYMGKEQILVEHEGKKYYGCCNMCKEKIPKDETARFATDPYSLEKVDKASAFIVVVGDNGEVAYFQKEENYHKFISES